MVFWRSVEGVTQTFPVLLLRKAAKDPDPLFIRVHARHNSLDLCVQVAQGIFPLGEDEHAPVDPFPVLGVKAGSMLLIRGSDWAELVRREVRV